MTEYSIDGRVLRAFGELRPTGQEADRDVHLALNMGRIVLNPQGGFYYVFLGGVPMFRKYDAAGKLIFERHIQGLELDDYVRSRSVGLGEARRERDSAGDASHPDRGCRCAGHLWISLAVPFTYVYDALGEKSRVVQFVAAGPLTPTG